jgi:hypothetical protein
MNSQMIFIILIIFAGYLIYDQYSKKDKIYCGFIRVDQTMIWKWVRKTAGRVEFDGGWYYIDPNCLIAKWHYIGYYYETIFKWDSSQPLNPKTFKNDALDPVSRKNLDKKEDIAAYNQAQREVTGKVKMGMLQQYLPIIMIVGFIIIGYFVFTMQSKISSLGLGQNAIEQMLGSLGAHLGE